MCSLQYSLPSGLARGCREPQPRIGTWGQALPALRPPSQCLTEERPAAGAQALLANGANRVATAGLAGLDALPIAQPDAAAPKLTRFPRAANATFAATQIRTAHVSNTVRRAAFTVGARLVRFAFATLPPTAIRSTGVGAATRRAVRFRWWRVRASSLPVPAFLGLDRGETSHGQQTDNQRAGGDADPASRPAVERLPVHDGLLCRPHPAAAVGHSGPCRGKYLSGVYERGGTGTLGRVVI